MSSFNLQDLIVGALGHAVKKHVEPRYNNAPLWDNGLGKFAEGLVQASVPNVTGDDIAEGALLMLGVRRPGQPRVIGRGRPSQDRASVDRTTQNPASGRVIEAEVLR